MAAAVPSAGSHAVQLYESRRFLHAAIAAFLAEGARHGDPLVMISRARTYTGVVECLRSGRHGPAFDGAERIAFMDADAGVAEMMEGGTLDLQRAEAQFRRLSASIQPNRAGGTVWVYGEMVDVLCELGHRSAAIRVEELWNSIS